MDIERMIRDLKAERDRLNEIIVAFEQLGKNTISTVSTKRRGRKFMDKDGRREVSERMRRYWAGKRKERQAAAPKTSSASADSAPSENPPDESSGGSQGFLASTCAA